MDETTDAFDRVLLNRIAAGDRAAFDAFYHRHAQRVAAFVVSLCGNADAEDVVSETFVGAWRSAGKFNGRSRVTTWLFGIAHHRAVDRLRNAARRNVVGLELLRDVAATDGDPVDAVLRTMRIRALDNAMGTLSPHHRAVLDLFYAHDRSIAEIATIVGVPVPTVKTRLFYARRGLQAALARTNTEATA